MNSDRRSFIRQSGLVTVGISLGTSVTLGKAMSMGPGQSDDLLRKLSKLNDQMVDDLLPGQMDKPGDRWDGGVMNGYQIPNVHSTNSFVVRLGTAYACKFSKYYLSDKLEQPLENAVSCMLRVQHEDGTIDLYSTNFHSTPDTAFLVNYVSPVYVLLKEMGRPGLEGFLQKLEQFLKNTSKCLLVGGIHTPNHRWVVCAALARINAFWPDKGLVQRIDEWLAEGIDQDPDGQFTEQSVSIYSPTCDDMFLTTGRLLDREDLLDVVRKNLDMTLYYIQPGGEVLTDASGRQDSARIGYVNRYFYTYRYFAIKDKNPVYAAVCALIEKEMPETISWDLSKLVELEVFGKALPAPTKIPDNYFKRFLYSGVTRIRRGSIDISVIEQNPTFLVFMKGRAVLQSLRLAAAFFGSRGQFISQESLLVGERIFLKKSETHGYYQPYPAQLLPGNGDWDLMPRTNRKMSELQTLDYSIEISEVNRKVSVKIEIVGTPDVPVSMEMSFREGGETEGVVENPHLQDSYFLENGYGSYQVGDDTITFGPGKKEHEWCEIRGMLPKQPGKSIYLTGYTPFLYTLELT